MYRMCARRELSQLLVAASIFTVDDRIKRGWRSLGIINSAALGGNDSQGLAGPAPIVEAVVQGRKQCYQM